MKFSKFIRRGVVALAATLSVTITSATPSRAQGWGFGFSDLFSSGPSSKHGTRLRTRHAPGTILVSFSDRRLYFIQGRGRAISYPIAVPKPSAAWSGTFRITRKAVAPRWTPTPEMRAENPKLPLFVRGGDPKNPLGTHALYIGNTLYRIHGTDAPWLIGQNVSHGCIRMYNRDVKDLFRRVRVGAKVIVTYRRYRG